MGRSDANDRKAKKQRGVINVVAAAATTEARTYGAKGSAAAARALRGGIPTLLQFEPQRRSLQATYLHEELIYSIPSFLSRAECKRVMQFADEAGFARVTQRATKYYAFRDNDRILRRMPEFAELLWRRMEALVPAEYDGMYAMGLNPSIRFYRYNQGQRFGCHVDQSDIDPETRFHSRFTVLVYLNDANDSNLVGGNTIFYANEAGARKEDVVLSVAPETGAALVHGHGDQCLLHEGALVTQGAKYLLRTDVMYSKHKPAKLKEATSN